jgi:serine/threonine protein phosphatase PrpC
MVLLYGNKCHIGWAGDARVVIGDQVSQKVVCETIDHKPTQENEKKRLLDLQEKLYGNRDIADGDIDDHILRMRNGLLKIEGVVMVSRAIGCNMFKNSVIMEPEFFEHDMSNDEFIASFSRQDTCLLPF